MEQHTQEFIKVPPGAPSFGSKPGVRIGVSPWERGREEVWGGSVECYPNCPRVTLQSPPHTTWKPIYRGQQVASHDLLLIQNLGSPASSGGPRGLAFPRAWPFPRACHVLASKFSCSVPPTPCPGHLTDFWNMNHFTRWKPLMPNNLPTETIPIF